MKELSEETGKRIIQEGTKHKLMEENFRKWEVEHFIKGMATP